MEHNNTNDLLAVVNYNAVGTWLEPYIGMTLKVIKKGVRKTWFYMDYGTKIEKCKFDSILFTYCFCPHCKSDDYDNIGKNCRCNKCWEQAAC